MNKRAAKTKRTTANLPLDLLEEAMAVTGKGITETLVDGLKLVRRSKAHQLAEGLRGELTFNFDADVSRERTHR